MNSFNSQFAFFFLAALLGGAQARIGNVDGGSASVQHRNVQKKYFTPQFFCPRTECIACISDGNNSGIPDGCIMFNKGVFMAGGDCENICIPWGKQDHMSTIEEHSCGRCPK